MNRALTTRLEALERRGPADGPAYLCAWAMRPEEVAAAVSKCKTAGREVVFVELVGVKPSPEMMERA